MTSGDTVGGMFAQTMTSFDTRVARRLRLWSVAIRNAFVALLPLTLIGAMAVVIAHVPFAGHADWMAAQFGAGALPLIRLVGHATLGLMGLAGAVSIAVYTSASLGARSRRQEPGTSVAAVAGAAFLMVVLNGTDHRIELLGYASIFQGIVVGVLTAELMALFERWLPMKTGLACLDSGTSLDRALRLSEQAALVLITIAAGHWAVRQVLAAAEAQVLLPLATSARGLGLPAELLNVSLVLFNQLLWTVGINGGQVLLHWSDAGMSFMAPSTVAWATGVASPMFVNAFAHLGGAGATAGLILACLVRCKDPALRKLAWVSIPAALLNVNELLLFGIPLVFSRALLLPFVLAPVVNVLIAMAAMRWLGLSFADGKPVVWSVPMLLSGYSMSGSWLGAAVQLVSLAVSALIYAPFLRRFEAQRRQRGDQALRLALKSLAEAAPGPTALLDRADTVGEVARELLADFRADLGGPRVTLAYQPQHARDGSVVGFEALLRWRHADHGPIPTQAIINVAEECEVIHHIGDWVVQQACRDLAGWRQGGLGGFKVGVNLSPVQLENPASVQTIAAALRTHGLDNAALDIDITEGQMMSSTLQAERSLAELQAMNVPMSMDDFGMGCTSLLYMQRFRMHCIKLDGSLTRDGLANPVNQDIVRCVARLGASQGVLVVAEFVETAPQRDLLESLGCDYFQGWLYSPAIPAAEVPGYLAKVKAVAAAPVSQITPALEPVLAG